MFLYQPTHESWYIIIYRYHFSGLIVKEPGNMSNSLGDGNAIFHTIFHIILHKLHNTQSFVQISFDSIYGLVSQSYH